MHAGEERGDWRIYAIDIAGIWVCFAESLDGEALILESMVPKDFFVRREAIERARSRIGS